MGMTPNLVIHVTVSLCHLGVVEELRDFVAIV